MPATLARNCAGRRCWCYGRRGQLARYRLKRRVAATAAKLHAFGETRLAPGAHNDDERRRVSTASAVETSAARGCELITRTADLELRFDNLFGHVAADLDHPLVVRFT